MAAGSGHTNIVEYFIDKGADVNKKDVWGVSTYVSMYYSSIVVLFSLLLALQHPTKIPLIDERAQRDCILHMHVYAWIDHLQ